MYNTFEELEESIKGCNASGFKKIYVLRKYLLHNQFRKGTTKVFDVIFICRIKKWSADKKWTPSGFERN